MMLLEGTDTSSMLLIASLLEEDIRFLAKDIRKFEHIQPDKTQLSGQAASARVAEKMPELPAAALGTSDAELALAMLAVDVRMISDTAHAQALQHSDVAACIVSQQYAQQLFAAEKKILLDTEYARRLQQLENRREVVGDPAANDDDLGQRKIERILAENPNEKGKGKARALAIPDDWDLDVRIAKSKIDFEDSLTNFLNPFWPASSTCGICFDEFQVVHSPVNAADAQNVGSSKKLPFGIEMPCPVSHEYCQGCLVQYIKGKVDPLNDGSGNPNTVVFPIRCPGCPITTEEDGIPDDVAERVLTKKDMLTWHHQKVSDSVPRLYCANKHCSALIHVAENIEQPQVQCMACDTVMCVPCEVSWHEDLTCEEYQALPFDERSPEDQQALQLMRANHWRRCPECHFIVELTIGCNHINCRCGCNFCFKCGTKWKSKCTRIPSCENWDEHMLYEEQERRRETRTGVDVYVPPCAHAANNDVDVMAWMLQPGALYTQHWFTGGMVAALTCGYCNARLNSLAELCYHLSRARGHDVYACCGRFFKRATDFKKHVEMKWGLHENQVRR
ncbi:hypothetical protein BC835DRAFT_1406347 [Cytidiella melzeri]|nr:hypothetical protein BC835DRAFT_1406347 [Cytidiella melzeri]